MAIPRVRKNSSFRTPPVKEFAKATEPAKPAPSTSKPEKADQSSEAVQTNQNFSTALSTYDEVIEEAEQRGDTDAVDVESRKGGNRQDIDAFWPGGVDAEGLTRVFCKHAEPLDAAMAKEKPTQ